jgi:phospholipid-binding lipoprotein MlaA
VYLNQDRVTFYRVPFTFAVLLVDWAKGSLMSAKIMYEKAMLAKLSYCREKTNLKPAQLILILLVVLLFTSCATTSPVEDKDVDPYENVNRKIYRFNLIVDENIMKPIADGYVKITPQPIQNRVTNFFSNLAYINVFINDFLQGKLDQGLLDTARFVFNSTFGVFGLFDVASGMGLKPHEEDLGQTLAKWGVAQGPYLVLPFFGPYTLRGTPNLVAGVVANPLFYVDDLKVTVPLSVLNVVDLRARVEGALQFVNEAAVDPYSFMREAYLQRRKYLIYDGEPPEEDLFDELEEWPE